MNKLKQRKWLRSRAFMVTLQLVVLGVAIGFIVFGVVRKEHKDVERKAVNVCLECIGIG